MGRRLWREITFIGFVACSCNMHGCIRLCDFVARFYRAILLARRRDVGTERIEVDWIGLVLPAVSELGLMGQ